MNIILGLLLLTTSILLTKVFCLLADNTRLMDKPNERSMHSRPTIRGGGLVFIGLPLMLLPLLCYFYNVSVSHFGVLILSTLVLAIVSFWDDLYQLSVKPRIIVQSLVALLIAVFMRPDNLDFGLFSLTTPLLTIPVLFITVLWAINHFNFMDGLDGICALQAAFIFSAYAVLFGLVSAFLYQDFCLILIGSLLGFLVYNFPPARLFMGDIGSATLGLLVFCIALLAQQQLHIPIIYWFMLNALFLFDATITLIRRFLKKEKWSAPHRKHAYQRLKQSGWSNRKILFFQFLSNTFFLLLVLMVDARPYLLMPALAVQMCYLSAIYCLIERKMPMFQ